MIEALIIFAAVGLLGAWFHTDQHAYLIRLRLMTPKIKQEWTTGGIGLLALIAVVLWSVGLATPWQAMCLATAAWCLHVVAFRISLNKHMGWHRFYLGSTSIYDVTFIRLAILLRHGSWPQHWCIAPTHQGAYKHSEGYRDTVHLGGKIATAFELAAVVGMVYCAYL